MLNLVLPTTWGLSNLAEIHQPFISLVFPPLTFEKQKAQLCCPLSSYDEELTLHQCKMKRWWWVPTNTAGNMSATRTQGVPPKRNKIKHRITSKIYPLFLWEPRLSFPLNWQMKSLLCWGEWAVHSFKLIYRQKYSVTHSDYFILTIWASWQNKNQMRKKKTPGSLILWNFYERQHDE